MRGEVGRVCEGFSEGASGAHRSRFCVGGVSVQMAGDCAGDVTLIPSLEPFRLEPGASDINIRVNRVRSLPPASGRHLFDSGTTWGLSESEAKYQFDFNAAIFGDRPFKRLLIDAQFRNGTLQMSEECLADLPNAVEPLGYPLDELLIMHRLTQERAIELHSCGIVRVDGGGDLFVGHSGAGKSTTTRLWTEREDVEVLSDDRIIVRRDEEAGVGMSRGDAGSVQDKGILRLRDRSASPTCHFAQDDTATKRVPPPRSAQGRNDNGNKGKMRMYGTPWHGEAMYASPNSAPLSRIFILEHGHGNVLTRLSPSQAVAELFARSFVPFHRHEYVDAALDFLQELVGSVPCYHFAFEPDQRAVETVLNFRD